MQYKGSIKKRLTSIIVSVTILTALIGYSSFVYWYMTNQYNNVLKLSKSVALVLGQDIAKLVLLNDISVAADITTKLKSFKNLDSMVLYKLDNTPILQYSQNGKSFVVDKLPNMENRNTTVDKQFLKLYVDANYQNNHLGYIQFKFSIKSIYDVIKKDIYSILTILLIMLIFSYILATLSARRFTKPILKLVTFLENVDFSHSLNKEIHTSENNEFGKLYNEVNIMLDRLEKAKLELQIAAAAFDTQNGMVITDKHQKILKVNKAFTNITGYTAKEAEGKTPSILKSGMHGEEFYKKMYKSLQLNHFWMGEINNKHKDGTVVNELLIIHSIIDDNNEVLYYVSSFSDITLQKRAEAELKLKEELLIQKSKMASMGQMLENIAHQWRQPLSIISTTSSGLLLRKDMGMEIPKEDEVADLEKIGDTVKYLSQTIEDFRNYFNPNRNKELFNLKECYEKSLKLLNTKFSVLNIKVTQRLEDVNVLGYENEFTQVIMNLLNNTKDALVEKNKENRLMFISIYKDKNNAIFSVKDSGGGIPAHIMDKIFEPYFTTKGKEKGTGIGLYMSREIVEKHMDGKLELQNKKFIYEEKEYIGAHFKIILPLKQKNKK
ncbi:PAS domain S-box protein [Halarcobacter sp.]|uniref:PAS domain S-box protein n=1 Tax=Halarcobacter sp. TaxID=2321133 RepID=UPI002AA893A0|nr:PAS domain S-box protein [Halarcobacter sp.]